MDGTARKLMISHRLDGVHGLRNYGVTDEAERRPGLVTHVGALQFGGPAAAIGPRKALIYLHADHGRDLAADSETRAANTRSEAKSLRIVGMAPDLEVIAPLPRPHFVGACRGGHAG